MSMPRTHTVHVKVESAPDGGCVAVLQGPYGETREDVPRLLALALGMHRPGGYVLQVRRAIRRVRPIISSAQPVVADSANFTCPACGHRDSFEIKATQYHLPRKCPGCARAFGSPIGIRGLCDDEGNPLIGDE